MKLKKRTDVTQSNISMSKKSNSLFSDYADFFEQNKLDELIIDEKDTKIIFRKHAPALQQQHIVHAPTMGVPVPTEEITSDASTSSVSTEPAVDDSNLVKIVSPLNGSFYSSPSPDSPAFVTNGDVVSVGQELCIVEAMKIFNEIKSDTNGKIEKILVKNGDAVKKGQPLFLINPA